MKVFIVIWQYTSVTKIIIYIQHRFPPQLQLLPTNYKNEYMAYTVFYDTIDFILFIFVYVS